MLILTLGGWSTGDYGVPYMLILASGGTTGGYGRLLCPSHVGFNFWAGDYGGLPAPLHVDFDFGAGDYGRLLCL